MREVDLVREMAVGHAVFGAVAVVAPLRGNTGLLMGLVGRLGVVIGFRRVAILNRHQMATLPIPGRFQADTDSIIEIGVRVIDFEVRDAGLDDGGFERVGVEVESLAHARGVARVEPLGDGGREGVAAFGGEVEELVELAGVGDVNWFGVEVAMGLLGQGVEEVVQLLVLGLRRR